MRARFAISGNSNFAAWQITEAEWTARTSGSDRFISAQNEYNLLKRDAERDLVPALVRYGLGLLPFYPLANGLLTGKYHRGEPPPTGSRVVAWGKQGLLTDPTFDVVERLSGRLRRSDRSACSTSPSEGSPPSPLSPRSSPAPRRPIRWRRTPGLVAGSRPRSDLAEIDQITAGAL